MATDNKKELWIQFAHDAQSRYVIPEEVEDQDELVDDMVEVATKYADSMLDEYEGRFEEARGSSRRRGKRKPKSETEED